MSELSEHIKELEDKAGWMDTLTYQVRKFDPSRSTFGAAKVAMIAIREHYEKAESNGVSDTGTDQNKG